MMALRTSSTGSWPPVYDPDVGIDHLPADAQDRLVRQSIERAILDQIEIGIDVLVDGQVRGDIVSLFARKLPGYVGDTLPYRIVEPIRIAEEGITVTDYLYAKQLAGDRPLKAHVTGPMTMTRGSTLEAGSGYTGRNDPHLVLDLAKALGHEARFLVQAGADVIQIDEPVLADGVDLNLAFEAMKQIIEIAEIPIPALHACGNVTGILRDVLTRSPVKMVSIEGVSSEGAWPTRRELDDIDDKYLARCGKQIGLGCIKVADYTIERLSRVQSFLDEMVLRLGEENIWAAMPNCGLRPVPAHIAVEKLKVMVEAAKSI
jgi:5-methyltetrahydropteroyltriglutamate--homocysteine methyltransferase